MCNADATGADDYLSSPYEPTVSASNPCPSLSSSTTTPPMNHHLGSEATQLSFLDVHLVPGMRGGVPQGEAPACHSDVLAPLFEAYDGTGRCSIPIKMRDPVSLLSVQVLLRIYFLRYMLQTTCSHLTWTSGSTHYHQIRPRRPPVPVRCRAPVSPHTLHALPRTTPRPHLTAQ